MISIKTNLTTNKSLHESTGESAQGAATTKVVNETCYASSQKPASNFQKRHARAFAQAISDILRESGNTTQNLFGRFYQFYLKQFEQFDDVTVMKQIKAAICYWTAQRLRQLELPDKPILRLWPHFIVRWIRHKSRISTNGGSVSKFRFIHSVAQCKGVMESPSKEFYLQAYEKHAATLSKAPVETPKQILLDAYAKGKAFGKKVKRFYKPFETKLPSSSATFDIKKSEGGKKSCLLKNNRFDHSTYRVEPTVLVLHGPPGTGKSHLVHEICKSICNKEQVEEKGSVFVRNCNTAHWDGYQGQMITLLDDWGQNVVDSTDVIELIALVTENAYPLPMADLREKGTLFTSRYILICTNLFSNSNVTIDDDFTHRNGETTVLSMGALHRRLHHCYQLLDAKTETVQFRETTSLFADCKDLGSFANSMRVSAMCRIQSIPRTNFINDITETVFDDSTKRQVGLLKSLPELSYDYRWIQKVYHDRFDYVVNGHIVTTRESLVLEFPIVPPADLPKVRVCAVAKPLGARMVTCGDANLHVLKPLQMAMHKALGEFPRFQATHGRPLKEILPLLGKLNDDEFILSGDYESATDGMNIDLSQALLNGILSEIEHEPTKQWALYEIGNHEVIYPSWTGISPILQETGQLMGSLLSFPLLCLANDLVTDLAGIRKNKLINGDDLLCKSTKEQYEEWKRIGSICGMKPSLGKNYQSREFGTFNSQLIVRGNHVPYINLKLVYRESSIDNCAKVATQAQISKKLLVKRMKKLLLKTPASLDVSVTKGGLGNETTKSDNEISMIDKCCYFARFLQKERGRWNKKSLPEGYEWLQYPSWETAEIRLSHNIPGLSAEKMDLYQSVNNDEAIKQHQIRFADVRKIKKRIEGSPILRELCNKTKFSSLPDLDKIVKRVTIVHRNAKQATFERLYSKFLQQCL